jgi:cytochrome c oxidase assembly protein subunit 15
VAQIFFSLLVAMALFTSGGWLRAETIPSASPHTRRLKTLALATVGMLYVQIILGALLRHPGTGVHLLFAGIHITGAFIVVGLVVATFKFVRAHFGGYRLLNKAAWMLLGAVGLQFLLGFCAFAVLLAETQMAQRSVLQVVLNTSHLLVGALLMASAVSLALLSLRQSASVAASQESTPVPQPI